jgi:hypothetical protein
VINLQDSLHFPFPIIIIQQSRYKFEKIDETKSEILKRRKWKKRIITSSKTSNFFGILVEALKLLLLIEILTDCDKGEGTACADADSDEIVAGICDADEAWGNADAKIDAVAGVSSVAEFEVSFCCEVIFLSVFRIELRKSPWTAFLTFSFSSFSEGSEI